MNIFLVYMCTLDDIIDELSSQEVKRRVLTVYTDLHKSVRLSKIYNREFINEFFDKYQNELKVIEEHAIRKRAEILKDGGVPLGYVKDDLDRMNKEANTTTEESINEKEQEYDKEKNDREKRREARKLDNIERVKNNEPEIPDSDDEYVDPHIEIISELTTKVFKEISRHKHPDRFPNDEKIAILYREAIEAHKKGDILTLLAVAYYNNMDIEIELYRSNIDVELDKYQEKADGYKSTVAWKWHYGDEHDRKVYESDWHEKMYLDAERGGMPVRSM